MLTDAHPFGKRITLDHEFVRPIIQFDDETITGAVVGGELIVGGGLIVGVIDGGVDIIDGGNTGVVVGGRVVEVGGGVAAGGGGWR